MPTFWLCHATPPAELLLEELELTEEDVCDEKLLELIDELEYEELETAEEAVDEDAGVLLAAEDDCDGGALLTDEPAAELGAELATDDDELLANAEMV